MALKRRSAPQEKSTGNDNFTNLVDGQEYEGRLVYVADLGLHTREWKGEVKPSVQKLALGYEIIGETVETDDGTLPRLLWDKPFNIYHELTDKGAELAAYKTFDPTAADGETADWEAYLGTPVNITIKHVKKDDSTYDNIGGVTAIPKKYQKDVGPATIEPCIGDADDADNPCTKALYGLTAWFYERRIDEGPNQDDQEYNDDDDIPF